MVPLTSLSVAFQLTDAELAPPTPTIEILTSKGPSPTSLRHLRESPYQSRHRMLERLELEPWKGIMQPKWLVA